MQALVVQAILLLLSQREVPVSQVTGYAAAIERAVSTEAALPFDGPRAREKTADLVAAIFYRESSFLQAVADCTFRTDRGFQDWGRSIGLGQLYRGVSWAGYRREEICGDVELQARLTIRYMVGTMRRCHRHVELALGAYNSSSCQVTAQAARTYATFRRLESLRQRLD